MGRPDMGYAVNTVLECNACHKDQGFPFIKYELPRAPAMPLSVSP